jgi:hypothetical protein
VSVLASESFSFFPAPFSFFAFYVLGLGVGADKNQDGIQSRPKERGSQSRGMPCC